MKSTVVTVFLLLVVLHSTSGAVLYVTPIPGTPCPAKPCHTLSQYAHNVSEYISAHTTFVFLPGDHSLDTDFNISDISSLLLLGNTSSLPLLTSRVVCSNTNAAMIAVKNVSTLAITALNVFSCHNSVAVKVHSVENCTLSSFHLSNSSPLHVHYSTVVLQNGTFTNNTGTGCGGSLRVEDSNITLTGTNSFVNNNCLGSGGGMCVEGIESTVFGSGSVSFIGNNATDDGGALNSDALLHYVGDIVFVNNSAPGRGGAIVCYNNVILSGNISIIGNNAGNGGGISSIGCRITGYLTVKGNTALSRSGLSIVGGPASISGIVEVTNNINGPAIAIDTNVKEVGELNGTFLFENNTGLSGAGLYVLGSQLTLSGTFVFRNNKAYDGGGLLLGNGATLNFLSNTTMLFSGNIVGNTGGAIYIADNDLFLYCNLRTQAREKCMDDCFFQVPSNYSNVQLAFEYNLADTAGDDIYGGQVDKCRTKNHNSSTLVFNTITKNSPLSISSPAYELHRCSSEYNVTFAYPGETVSIPVTSMGQRGGFSPANVRVLLSDGDIGHAQQLQRTNSSHECTYLQYTLLTSLTSWTVIATLYADEPCGSRNGVSLKILIDMKECPPGFELLLPLGSCNCEKRLQPYDVTCDINNQSIMTGAYGNVWVGYDNNSSYNGLIIHSHCPNDFCKEGRVSFTLNSTDLQCAHNRSGLLCGACQEGLSLKLGSAHCDECTNVYLLLFVVFVVAGIALVMLLLVLRLTVAQGTINGLIFYANVFQSKNHLFLPNNQCIVLKVFLAWLNLDFGIDSCLYDGMDTYQNTWLQFLFPVYIWLLIGLVICISRWSSWVTRRLGTNPVAVLATLVLLSYNKILQTIITALSPTELQYAANTKIVWLYDGNRPFLEGKHIPLFVTSLLVLVFLFLPYTLLLVFGQCLQANSNRFIFSWVNRPTFKFFLDNYHAPYQNKHRYWTGLMLMLRIVLLVAFASDITNDPSITLLTIITVVVCVQSLVGVFGSPNIYKSQRIAVLDAAFLFNLVILSAATYYCQQSDGNQAAVGYTSLGVAFLIFVVILIYHVFMQVKDTAFGRKLSRKWKKDQYYDYDEDGENVDLILQRE